MQNIKLVLEYDGTAYHGYQRQENAITVQQLLEEALFALFCRKLPVTAAGRTDTGVHATGQVVNFQVKTRIPLHRIPHALNSLLPCDIVVREAEEVPAEFHARFWASSKVYTYTIDNAAFPRVLTRHTTCYIRFPLDVGAMQKAALTLVGQNDFTSFMAGGSKVKDATRRLLRLEVGDADGYITITAEADGFLYNMVRIITGTLVEVGRGKRAADLSPVLAERSRKAAGWTAPPHGLVLREVKYERTQQEK